MPSTWFSTPIPMLSNRSESIPVLIASIEASLVLIGSLTVPWFLLQSKSNHLLYGLCFSLVHSSRCFLFLICFIVRQFGSYPCRVLSFRIGHFDSLSIQHHDFESVPVHPRLNRIASSPYQIESRTDHCILLLYRPNLFESMSRTLLYTPYPDEFIWFHSMSMLFSPSDILFYYTIRVYHAHQSVSKLWFLDSVRTMDTFRIPSCSVRLWSQQIISISSRYN